MQSPVLATPMAQRASPLYPWDSWRVADIDTSAAYHASPHMPFGDDEALQTPSSSYAARPGPNDFGDLVDWNGSGR
jgi:hypothetical protein